MTQEDRDRIHGLIDETFARHGAETTVLKVDEWMETSASDLLDRYNDDRGEFAAVYGPYYNEKARLYGASPY